MAILQVKGMASQLYEALRRRAQMENRSISQEVIAIIQEHLSRPAKHDQKATDEFLKLSGAWAGPESAEDLAKQIRGSRKHRRREVGSEDVFN